MKLSRVSGIFAIALSSLFLSSCVSTHKAKSREANMGSTPTTRKPPADAPTVAIIGSGPGGAAAAVYAARAGLRAILFTGMEPGGAITRSPLVENWLGEASISGKELGEKFIKHAEASGAEVVNDAVEKIIKTESGYKLRTMALGKQFEADFIVAAMGGNPRKLGIDGEDELVGRGVSYCATCDGPFYKDKIVAVVGGGNTAMIDAEELSRYAKKVYMIIRSSPKATDQVAERVKANPKVEMKLRRSISEFVVGKNGLLEGVKLRKTYGKGKDSDGSESEEFLKLDGVFVAIGTVPNSSLLEGLVELDRYRYPVVNEYFQTSDPRIYAVGDLIRGEGVARYNQLMNAAAAGATAIMHALNTTVPHLEKK